MTTVKCELCAKDKQLYGNRIQIRDKKKYKDSFYICTDHVPFSDFTVESKIMEG